MDLQQDYVSLLQLMILEHDVSYFMDYAASRNPLNSFCTIRAKQFKFDICGLNSKTSWSSFI